MTGADKAIRYSTIAAVAVVAGIAGWVSYVHAYDVIRSHGEAGLVGRIYPGTVDGLIYCASMVLLDAARRGVPAPALARWLLAAGIGATLFANVLAGLSYGALGAVVAAWPALALVGSYELLMAMVRGRARVPAQTLPEPPADAPAEDVPAAPAPASVPGLRQLQRELHVGAPKARQVQQLIRASMNGHAPAPEGGDPGGPQAQ